MTVAMRQWSARGGPLLLGKLVPALAACVGIAALAGTIALIKDYGWSAAMAPAVVFAVFVLIAGWLVWKLLRTAWLVVLADDTITCLATSGRWTFGPGEIVAVTGDVYHMFLHIAGSHSKASVWALRERDSLLAAIERMNPGVEFAPWIQPTKG